MGFKALNQDDEAIYSFNFNQDQWIDFKSNHNKQFKMSCCDAVAIPKTSKYGVNFFAHKANSCGSSESVEHQFIKYLSLIALRDNGWNVDTEVRIKNGEDLFISDVYAEKGNVKLAIEVQWSPITKEELQRRHNKYKRAGISCLWFCKNKPSMISKEIPVFPIKKNINNSIVVILIGVLSNASYDGFFIDIHEFISIACNMGLKHVCRFEKIYFVTSGEYVSCEKCKHVNKIPLDVDFYCDFKGNMICIKSKDYLTSGINGTQGLINAVMGRHCKIKYKCSKCSCLTGRFPNLKNSNYIDDGFTEVYEAYDIPRPDRWLLFK